MREFEDDPARECELCQQWMPTPLLFEHLQRHGYDLSGPEISDVRPVDDDHQVVTVRGGHGGYRRSPCGGCPWRVDQTGSFPAGAFLESARTAHDMAGHTFGCHESGTGRPVTCAGFLLRGADHNMAVRLRSAAGDIDLDSISDGGHELHPGYVSMALANGVDEGDPGLYGCRYSYAEEGR